MTHHNVTGVFVGLTTLDCVYRVTAPPGPNEKVSALRLDLGAGGPAANAAITFVLLGGDAVLVTDIGVHPLARAAGDDLTEYGVGVRPVEPGWIGPATVSSIYVTESTGDRSVVYTSPKGRSPAAPSWLPEVIDDADIVLVDGHHPDVAVAAARASRERGVPVLLDGGSWKPCFDELLPLVDIAVCSAVLRLPDGSGDPAAVAAELRRRGVRQVAVSRGPDPILWWDGESSGAATVPAVTVRDTLGAGDVLHGACAWHLARGAGFADALTRAGAVAARRCEHVGLQAWRADLRGATPSRFTPS